MVKTCVTPPWSNWPADEALDDFAANGSDDGDLRSHLRRIFDHCFGIVQAERAQGVFAGLHIRLRLGAGGFRLLKVGLGDCAVRVEILRALIHLFGEKKRIAGFDVRGARRGVVRAVYREQRLSGVHRFARSNQDLVHGATDGAENGRSLKRVVRDVSREAQQTRELGLFHGDDLDVGQLIGRNTEQRGSVCFGLRAGVGGHLRFGIPGARAATGKGKPSRECRDRKSASRKKHFSHGRVLVPTAWRICSSAVMYVAKAWR